MGHFCQIRVFSQCLGLFFHQVKGPLYAFPCLSFGHAGEAEFRIPSEFLAHGRFSNCLT